MEIDWTPDLTLWPTAAPLQQSLAYGQAMRSLGADVRCVALKEHGLVVAYAQILQRLRLRVILRGPLWQAPCDRALALRHLARWPGGTLATPEDPISGFGLIPLITPRHHALWDLTGDEGILRAGLHGKWRNRLLQAEGLTIRQGNAQTLNTLIANEQQQRRDRGYRGLPGAFLRTWRDPMVLHWSPKGQVEAGMVFMRHGDWASYQLGWASPMGRQAFAHGPMLWQAMLRLKAQGVTTVDLGDVSDANPGLARFKLGTGAQVKALGATCLVVPR